MDKWLIRHDGTDLGVQNLPRYSILGVKYFFQL